MRRALNNAENDRQIEQGVNGKGNLNFKDPTVVQKTNNSEKHCRRILSLYSETI